MEIKNKLVDILNDDYFIEMMLKISNDDNELKEAIDSRKQSLKANKLYIAVFGIQGAGKSSLLNALVAEDDILPVEADETTCIPVELHKSRNNNKKGEIYYKDGRIEEIIVSREKLDKFVNNVYNPENKLGVDYIKIYLPSSFLREDIVFVDLPGVASLREGNQETTMRYISSCTGSIFMLRTVPPITKFESVLLKLVLPKISHNFFVQNHWTGETRKELENGTEHNRKILKKLLSECNIEKEIEILPVQVKDAVKGTYMQDHNLIKNSGLTVLKDILLNSFDNWQDQAYKEIALWIKSHSVEIKRYYLQVKDDLSKDIEQTLNNLISQQEEYKEKKIKLKEEFKELKDKTYNIEDRIKTEMRNYIKKTEKEELDKLNEKINQGIYDGQYLKSSIEDTIKEIQGIVAEELQFQLEEMTMDILGEFKGIIEDMVNYKEQLYDGIVIDEINSFKGEKILPSLGGIGGLLGGKFLGAKAGVLIAAAFNPAGWVVAGVAIASALIGSFFGGKAASKAKEKIEKKRANKAKRIAQKNVKNTCNEIKNNIINEVKKYRDNLVIELENILEKELNNIESQFEERIRTLQNSKDNKEKILKENKEKLYKINSIINIINNILE